MTDTVPLGSRWTIEQVIALTSTSARFGAGEAVAVPTMWSHTGASERAVWGRYHGRGAEPYEVAVDHEHVTHRCTCPSRVRPCKHVVGLLVMWVRGLVADVAEPVDVSAWIDREQRRRAETDEAPAAGDSTSPDSTGSESSRDAPGDQAGADPDARPDRDVDLDRDGARDERIARLLAGLVELDRWLEDRLRTGLADPSIARFATWDDVASRLVDARAGALANRVRRLAGRVGSSPDWHEGVLAEMGILHLIAQAGQRVPSLPSALADTVAVACGWQVRKADVESSAPETDRWLVLGRSDTREDLVEVRRVWMRGLDSGRSAMVLSFAAYRQSLDTSLAVGSVVSADVHRYPGSSQRVIVGEHHDVPGALDIAVPAATVAEAFDEIGRVLTTEPWLDRVPALVRASPAVANGGGWSLTDHTGSMSIAGDHAGDAVAVLLAASAGAPITVTVEWTAAGVVPLTVFLPDRVLDIGPRADSSFVSAA